MGDLHKPFGLGCVLVWVDLGVGDAGILEESGLMVILPAFSHCTSLKCQLSRNALIPTLSLPEHLGSPKQFFRLNPFPPEVVTELAVLPAQRLSGDGKTVAGFT